MVTLEKTIMEKQEIIIEYENRTAQLIFQKETTEQKFKDLLEKYQEITQEYKNANEVSSGRNNMIGQLEEKIFILETENGENGRKIEQLGIEKRKIIEMLDEEVTLKDRKIAELEQANQHITELENAFRDTSDKNKKFS